MPHWNGVDLWHAVVVVGISQTHVYVNDPDEVNAPTPIPIGDFDLAWLAQNERYAVLS
ncbi:MAG: hypothetical protein AAF639_39415 [Chloroflexota bacterium]